MEEGRLLRRLDKWRSLKQQMQEAEMVRRNRKVRTPQIPAAVETAVIPLSMFDQDNLKNPTNPRGVTHRHSPHDLLNRIGHLSHVPPGFVQR